MLPCSKESFPNKKAFACLGMLCVCARNTALHQFSSIAKALVLLYFRLRLVHGVIDPWGAAVSPSSWAELRGGTWDLMICAVQKKRRAVRSYNQMLSSE